MGKVGMDLDASPENVWESSVSITIELAAVLRRCVNSISNGEGSSLMQPEVSTIGILRCEEDASDEEDGSEIPRSSSSSHIERS